MNFETGLRSVIDDVDGALAAVLMGFDGIAVAEVKKEEPPFALSDLAVEYSQLLSEAIRVSQGQNVGGLTEAVLSTDRFRVILRILNPSYFIALILAADGNLGRGRYVLRRDLARFKADL